ncbi:hypothetical protein [Pelosinus sp. IPA-1]|uniref:hypothetical protein n=1 Tax=Pelosinus sp. IPA-1 TaxID=3029569 RepID=UPI00243623C5|nr:hypothetical protein [Pelosinus sp. IPA-1]GMA98848.1 hypothetical protein PIPA1_16480 [Pelosinus sp. IPA-1]
MKEVFYIKKKISFFNKISLYELVVLILVLSVVDPLLFSFLQTIGLDDELAKPLSGGIAIGSILLILGIMKDRIKQGILGLILCIFAAFIWGMSLSICVLCIFMDKINKDSF